MKKLTLCLSLLASACIWASTAAANPCCWDVDTDAGVVGAGDVPGFPHNPKGGGLPDPGNGAPLGWAQCTPTVAADCFKRTGIQEIWFDRVCQGGSASPRVPPDNSVAPNGYRCVRKAQTVQVAYAYKVSKGGPVTSPANQAPPVGTSGDTRQLEAVDVPGASSQALLVLVALLLGGATWVILRQRLAAGPTA